MTTSDKTMQSPGWAFFDKVDCISLASRPDRRQEAMQQFAAVGLAEQVEFILVQKNMADQVEGIFQSHMHCLKKGLAAGAHHILVFEDDIFFRGLNRKRLDEACRFMETTKDWNAFFLGCLTSGSAITGSPAVRQIHYRCLAHAYALNRPFAERLSREEWRGIPFDNLLRQHNDKFFAMHPMSAFQGLSGSDNRTVLLNRLRNLCGGLPFLQRSNEVFQNNKKIIVTAHILLAATAIALLFLGLR